MTGMVATDGAERIESAFISPDEELTAADALVLRARVARGRLGARIAAKPNSAPSARSGSSSDDRDPTTG